MIKVNNADPDVEVSAMVHRNHVNRAYLYEEQIADAAYETVREEKKRKPAICIFERKMQVMPRFAPDTKTLSIRMVSRILGVLARWGAAALFLGGVADGLIDTAYGLTLTIICIGWGLIYLMKVVAHV